MTKPNDGSPNALQTHFLAILPRIELHAGVYFRHIKCPHKKEDYIQETVSLAWKYFVRVTERGKDPLAFVSRIATFAALHAKSGRHVCGQEKAKDVLSPLAQRRHSFTVSRLPDGGSRHGNLFDEALADNTVSPIPEQVAFRIDFPAWLASWDERRRHIILDMTQGNRTLDLAERYGCSPARISQLRREFHQDWNRFTA
jgi:DNA-directed RNA polymerase specialized sigma24 family protein